MAVVLGFIGYQIESRVSSRSTKSLDTSINEEREKRLLRMLEANEQPEQPKTMFDLNNAKDLYK